MAITNSSQDQYVRLYEEFFGWTPLVFTYIVACEETGLLKFGKSATPEWRLVVMQVGCPTKLNIKWAWPEDVENELHKYFEKCRVRGEWFRVDLNNAIHIAGAMTKAKCKQAMKVFG